MTSRAALMLPMLLGLLLASCAGPEREVIERPRSALRPEDPWVIRSVLDEQPRMITVALHDDLWAAWDASTCQLYRVWKGGANWEGAVFTSEHGPQPTTRGWTYLEGGRADAWRLIEGDNVSSARPIYRGYMIRGDRLALRYELRFGSHRILVEERPDVELLLAPLRDTAVPVARFQRHFVTRGVPEDAELQLLTRFADPRGSLLRIDQAPGNRSWRPAAGPIEPSRIAINDEEPADFDTLLLVPRDTLVEELIAAEQGEPDDDRSYAPVEAEFPLAGQDLLSELGDPLELPGAPPHGPLQAGLSLRMYDIGEDMPSLPTLMAGQTPNVHEIVPILDLSDFGGDVFGLTDRFYVEAEGFLDVPRPGVYGLRLRSDDGSALSVNGVPVIDNDAQHGGENKSVAVELDAGLHEISVRFFENAGDAELQLYWLPPGATHWRLVPSHALSCASGVVRVTSPGRKSILRPLRKGRPGDGLPLTGVHPRFDLMTVRPEGFEPRVGGMDWLSDGRLVISTWDSEGAVWLLDGVRGRDRDDITARRFAAGLAEPLGLQVVRDRIFVLQKQELTELIDHDGDDVADEYRSVCSGWDVTPNFHEFAFGLAWDGRDFYANLAGAILPGGASPSPQPPERGSVIRIDPERGRYEIVARGLRTPNGIGFGVDDQLFITDNQGDWLPVSKLLHLQQGAFYGQRSVLGDDARGLQDTPPVVWLPQGEIGNSPSEPAVVPPGHGPYSGQMIHGEVTHGGIKRVFVDEVDGRYQGAVFRFTQGLEAGINRLTWGPDGALYVGGIGSTGNWGQEGKQSYGLQRLGDNGAPVFEMLAVRAMSNGIEIEFTEPLAPRQGWDVGSYDVRHWRYEPTDAYGGPKLDEETMEILSASVSPDRRRVFLQITELREDRVVYVRLAGPLRSEAGRRPWSTEAWYTLNHLPRRRAGQVLTPPPPRPHNVLTRAERDAGWRLLFDGHTTAGWRGFKRDDVAGWEAQDGSLARTGAGGDIITEEVFEDFELSFEWKISPKGNSGVLFNVTEGRDFVWETGPEMQVLDNDGHGDGLDPRTSAGANYALHAPETDVTAPVGRWNHARIVVKRGRVQHWLNDEPLLEYQLWSDDWHARVAASKFADMPDYGQARRGHIALQDHDDRVWYRNIKIREL